MVPLTLAIAAVAGPIASLLIPANAHTDCVRAEMVTTTTMLLVFAPQALLYRLSVVLPSRWSSSPAGSAARPRCAG